MPTTPDNVTIYTPFAVINNAQPEDVSSVIYGLIVRDGKPEVRSPFGWGVVKVEGMLRLVDAVGQARFVQRDRFPVALQCINWAHFDTNAKLAELEQAMAGLKQGVSDLASAIGKLDEVNP